MAECCDIKGLNLDDISSKAFQKYHQQFTSIFENIEIIVFEIFEN